VHPRLRRRLHSERQILATSITVDRALIDSGDLEMDAPSRVNTVDAKPSTHIATAALVRRERLELL